MPFERLVGLQVDDDESYTRYRAAMTPMLDAVGGGFRYDFQLAKVLRSEADAPMNRLFAIYFPDRSACEALFGDPAYKAIKAEHFSPAVSAATVLAEYER